MWPHEETGPVTTLASFCRRIQARPRLLGFELSASPLSKRGNDVRWYNIDLGTGQHFSGKPTCRRGAGNATISYPELYNTIRSNPNVCSGTPLVRESQDWKKRCLEILEAAISDLTSAEQRSAKGLLQSLFPRLKDSTRKV